MISLKIALAISIVLCGMVAGLLFAFAAVVMPGLSALRDLDSLRAFKAMDRIIQNNHPVFVTVWIGSAAALLIAALLAMWNENGLARSVVIAAAAVYLFGVQLPTGAVNVPLNNRLRQQPLDTLTPDALREVRAEFAPRWTRWNILRTVFAVLTVVLLIFAVFKL